VSQPSDTAASGVGAMPKLRSPSAPGAPITWDQWLMLQRDNVVAPGAEGLRSFGIAPTPLAAVSEGWLTAYRRGGRFAAKQPY
jgi:hypothetical protein